MTDRIYVNMPKYPQIITFTKNVMQDSSGCPQSAELSGQVQVQHKLSQRGDLQRNIACEKCVGFMKCK